MDRMKKNRSNEAIINKAVVSFIKQFLNKIIQFLPCHVLVLSFERILNHIAHFIELKLKKDAAFIILCRWTLHVFKKAAVINLVGEVLL